METDRLSLTKALEIAQERQKAEQILLRHYAENIEQNKGLSATELVVNAMIEFKNLK